MTSLARLVTEAIPLLDLRAQYESIRSEIREAVDEVLRSQQFVLGPQGEALEQEIAQLCGVRSAVGVGSGTDALELALQVCGVGNGDEVIVPAFTFIAPASAVCALGARPVFADIEPATFTLDPAQVQSLISARTRAIIAVHLYGLPANLDPILTAAARNGIPVIEDNAQAFGASYHGRKTGSMGRLGCLSFYPSKNLGAYGDAGMVVTNDPDVAARVRSLRNHGQQSRYLSTARGRNSRLDELQAAVLRVKLRHLEKWIAARQAHARRYDALLRDVPGVTVPHAPYGSEHVYSVYTIRVAGSHADGTTRSDVVQKRLAERGIASMVYYPVPLHLQPVFASMGGKPGDLRVSERAAREVLSLPIYAELAPAQIDRVAEEVQNALRD
jgi:UDP-2-acetamido-2-deoxy-ribo-hexuluronate aminotransferase